jgi:hypothetical protein
VQELDAATPGGALYGNSLDDAAAQQKPDYASLRQYSRQWRQQMQLYTAELTDYEQYLHVLRGDGVITYQQHLGLFHQKIDDIIRRLVILAPQFAAETYGDTAAQYVQQASMAFAAGQYAQAQMYLMRAEFAKDSRASVGCGGKGTVIATDSQLGSSELSVSDAIDAAKEDKKNWPWIDGICVVKTCSTRPGKTKVGPCNVCKKCQILFDKGSDPTKMTVTKRTTTALPAATGLIGLLDSQKPKYALAA